MSHQGIGGIMSKNREMRACLSANLHSPGFYARAHFRSPSTLSPAARPSADFQNNCLSAPNRPFYGVLRLYLPKPEVTSGQWKVALPTPVISKK
jgi:hypothetical protein